MVFIKDRGNIKWTALILPEHRAALRDWERAKFDVDPPAHDEYGLAELAEKLARAMQDGEVVTLTYWQAQDKRNYTVEGVVKRIDPIRIAVFIDVGTEEDFDKRWIEARYIVSVET